MGLRAFIYARISQDRTGAGLGVTRQEEDCRLLAKRLGAEVLQVFTDSDISAYSGKRRPAYEEMLAAMQQGAADVILCWHLDRLTRSTRDLETYIDISEKSGIATHAVQAGELDLATPSGRAVARTLGAWARYESEMKSERQKRQRQQARENGKWTGGVVPFGWHIVDGQPAVHEKQAELLRYAVDQIYRGASVSSLVKHFDASGEKSPRGANWNHVSLLQMMLRPKIAGLREVDGEIVDDPVFPAIIGEERWRGVRALLKAPERRVSFDNNGRWLLSGLAFCECGSTVKIGATRDHRGGRRAVYRCKMTGPGHINRAAENVDRYVNMLMPTLLRRRGAGIGAAAPQPSVANPGDLEAEANALRARLSEAASMAADGVLSMAQLGVMSKKLHSQLAEIEESMDKAKVPHATDFDAAAAWDKLTLDERRAVIRETVKVTIKRVGHAGRHFDYNSIHVELADPVN
ncbi:DNA invertase Pin-like site-specific DNA recombinase [Pseudarthrobacter oxydans]|uniref:DNA invertase Pin-like site-specific DNA recombinase n=1 Tax=Pseudarthrobacter oxydans TaxID=1671 RepID=A0AAW8NBL9_PSEOX|nr:recombinase family protein [Pseudarthrobacter oxydans]MDR6794329.1 DNA invertase Pin-like site-specific DNA recombinase [Pseudarthrobacter oxydans]MDR7164896.1 DNA invertase Pin-like site-specific DNA recombinase [Pseudarthrobacter oxydans]